MSAYRFGYSVVAATLHDERAVASLTAPVRALLDGLGGTADDGSTTDLCRTAAFQRAHPSACQRLEQRNRRN